MKRTFKLVRVETKDGYQFFEVYDMQNETKPIEAFKTDTTAKEWLYDIYGDNITIL